MHRVSILEVIVPITCVKSASVERTFAFVSLYIGRYVFFVDASFGTTVGYDFVEDGLDRLVASVDKELTTHRSRQLF